MASGTLSSRGDRGAVPAFVQQGQVDWVAFGNTAWNLTSAVLQRFSTAEVQPATYGAGLALGCHFKLGAIGSRRVEDALQQLKGSESFQKLLWFGFGWKHFVNLLSETQAGFNCLALCACLVDTHSHDTAANILSELWTVCEFPVDYQPSHVQFVNLVKTCEGVFARSSFGPTVERMVDLGEFFSRALDDEIVSPINWELGAKSRDIAVVLKALFDISQGKIETITIAGATECAFIGGVAQWLFDLNVYIEGISDTPHQNQTPHVIIQYDSPANAPRNAQAQRSVTKLKSATYYLKNTDNYWSQMSSADALDSRLILRVPWETCLSRSFGIYFDEICSISYALAEFLGSACRIYSAFAIGEEDLGIFEPFRGDYVDILDSCYGSGLAFAITSLFSELHNLENLARLMQLEEAKPFAEAVKVFQRSCKFIEGHCTCPRCRGTSAHFHGIGNSCILLIAYTILHITRISGTVERDVAILPTISGIREIHRSGPKDEGATYYQEFKNGYSYIHALLGLGRTNGEDLVIDPIVLFSGSPPQEERNYTGAPRSSSHLTAISWRGFCCYSSGLRKLSSQPEDVRIVHLLPGKIERGRRPYNAVYDFPDGLDTRNQMNRVQDMNIVDPDMTLRKSRSELRAIVNEQPGADAVYFAYTISLNPGRLYSGGPLPVLYLLPGRIAHTVLHNSCLIPCANLPKCSNEPPIQPQSCPLRRIPLNSDNPAHLTDASTGGLSFDGAGVACTISRAEEDDVDICVAIQLHELSNPKAGKILVRRHECIPCSLRAVRKYSPGALKEIPVNEWYPERKVVFHILNTQGTRRSGALHSSGARSMISE